MSTTPASSPPRLAILGAGAIGCMLAARLAEAAPQRPPTLIARGAALDALRAQGLLEWRDGVATQALSLPVASAQEASEQAGHSGLFDVVVLAVKAPALASAARDAAALLSPAGRVLVAMNGLPWWFLHGLPGPLAGQGLAAVDPDGALMRLLPPERVMGCVVHASSTSPAPGQWRHVAGRGLIVGEPGRSAPSALLRQTMAALAAAGFEVTHSPLIQADIWFKLWGNLTMNPISALTGATADRILDDELLRGFITACMLEAQAIGSALGCPIAQTPEQRHAVTRKLGAFKTSMLQDREAGREMEVEALVGAVHELGLRLALPTPHISALYGLARVMAGV